MIDGSIAIIAVVLGSCWLTLFAWLERERHETVAIMMLLLLIVTLLVSGSVDRYQQSTKEKQQQQQELQP